MLFFSAKNFLTKFFSPVHKRRVLSFLKFLLWISISHVILFTSRKNHLIQYSCIIFSKKKFFVIENPIIYFQNNFKAKKELEHLDTIQGNECVI